LSPIGSNPNALRSYFNMHKDHRKDFPKTLQPMGHTSDVQDIVDAVVYLTESGQVTGEVLHVDGGAHGGKW